jgi:hypothetical protein
MEERDSIRRRIRPDRRHGYARILDLLAVRDLSNDL